MSKSYNEPKLNYVALMKSIILHKLDDRLYESIKERASKELLSLNRFIKKTLEQSVGLHDVESLSEKRRRFESELGTWDEREIQHFDEKNEIQSSTFNIQRSNFNTYYSLIVSCEAYL